MPRVINGPLPRVRASKDLNTLVLAVFVHLLDAPNVAHDAVAEDLDAQVVGVNLGIYGANPYEDLSV
jgi:hypothetical protein